MSADLALMDVYVCGEVTLRLSFVNLQNRQAADQFQAIHNEAIKRGLYIVEWVDFCTLDQCMTISTTSLMPKSEPAA